MFFFISKRAEHVLEFYDETNLISVVLEVINNIHEKDRDMMYEREGGREGGMTLYEI